MNLNLLEEYVLLALDDDKGQFVIDSTALNYGFAGAVLLELALREKIEIQNDQLNFCDDTYESEIALNKMIDLLKEKQDCAVEDCIKFLAKRADDIKEDTLQHLINKEILKKSEKKIFWLIPNKKYPTTNATPENKVRKRLDDVLNDEMRTTVHDIMLLSLIQATDLVREAFREADDYEKIKDRIDEVTQDLKISKTVNQGMREIQAAIMMAVARTVVPKTSSS